MAVAWGRARMARGRRSTGYGQYRALDSMARGEAHAGCKPGGNNIIMEAMGRHWHYEARGPGFKLRVGGRNKKARHVASECARQ